jgi:hypothetical protein
MTLTSAQFAEMLARVSRNKQREAIAGNAEDKERDLHEKIFAECRRRGWVVFHGSMAERTHRTAGEPDFIIAKPGGTLYVEAKSRTGKLTPAQAAMRAHLDANGHVMHVVRSFEEFLSVANEQTT